MPDFIVAACMYCGTIANTSVTLGGDGHGNWTCGASYTPGCIHTDCADRMRSKIDAQAAELQALRARYREISAGLREALEWFEETGHGEVAIASRLRALLDNEEVAG